jgi:hypothetical protein
VNKPAAKPQGKKPPPEKDKEKKPEHR